MRAKRTHYEKEFKQTIVDLMGSGKSLKSVCSEYHLNENMVRRWKKEYQTDTGAFKDEATLLLEQENSNPHIDEIKRREYAERNPNQ